MRTARISDLGRGHPRAEFVPKLRVESFHRSDSEGCTIVIIERHSPDRFSTGIYMCAPRARGLAPSRVFLLYRTDNRLPTPPRTAPSWVSAGALANDSGPAGARRGSRPLRVCRSGTHAETCLACRLPMHT